MEGEGWEEGEEVVAGEPTTAVVAPLRAADAGPLEDGGATATIFLRRACRRAEMLLTKRDTVARSSSTSGDDGRPACIVSSRRA